MIESFLNKSLEILPIEKILSQLNNLSHGSYLAEAEKLNLDHTDLIAVLFNRESLEQRLEAEFQGIEVLDGFERRKYYDGKIYYAPLGTLLHITANNVFLGMLDSFIMGTLTRNKNIIKIPKGCEAFVELFQNTLNSVAPEIAERTLFMQWKGGDLEYEAELFSQVDAVLAWGGEEMERSLRSRVPFDVKLVIHGPKISFHVITEEGLKNLDFKKLIKDITDFDQQACANAQNIFLEEGIDPVRFARDLNSANSYTRNESPDEAVEILKQRHLQEYQEYLGGVKSITSQNLDIHFSESIYLEPTALNGSVKIKRFPNLDKLAKSLRPFKKYLQTCGLACAHSERREITKVLGRVGVNRFTEAGKMLSGLNGSPHDGEFNLMSLTQVICDELEGAPVKEYETPGFVFSTGGTTGDPKFTRYTYDEFEMVARILGKSYLAQGLTPKNKVANLFMPGNMWSSFSAVQMALSYAKATQFPLGGNTDKNYFSKIAKLFEIDTVFGLPSMLVDLSYETKNLVIDSIFYAGESLSREAMQVLKDNWQVKDFYSAGYASVDAGPIGYQDPKGEPGVHILFDQLVELEIRDGQGFISSKIRESYPVLNYPSGDLLEWIQSSDDKIRFKILGRADRKINIWSTRFELSDIEKILEDLEYRESFQIQLERLDGDRLGDVLKLVTTKPLDKESFLGHLYKIEDIRQTRSSFYISEHLELSCDHFLRNPKTGKQPKLMDLR